MSSNRTDSRVRVPGRVLSVRLAHTFAEDAVAADERRRRAEEDAVRETMRQEALETARAEMAARLETALRDLAGERERLRMLGDEILGRLEPHVVELSLAIARTLVAQDIDEGRVRIQPVVETVLRELRDPGAPAVTEVALCPEDYAALGHGALPEVDGVRLTADAEVPPGGCRVTTDAERIWSDLDTRVRTVQRALREGFEVTP